MRATVDDNSKIARREAPRESKNCRSAWIALSGRQYPLIPRLSESKNESKRESCIFLRGGEDMRAMVVELDHADREL